MQLFIFEGHGRGGTSHCNYACPTRARMASGFISTITALRSLLAMTFLPSLPERPQRPLRARFGAFLGMKRRGLLGILLSYRSFATRGHTCRSDREYLCHTVAPLMARKLPLYKMVTNAPLERTLLGAPPPSDVDIARWLREAIEVRKGAEGVVVPDTFIVLDCPTMRLEPGFVEFVSSSNLPFAPAFWSLIFFLSLLLTLLSSAPGRPHPSAQRCG